MTRCVQSRLSFLRLELSKFIFFLAHFTQLDDELDTSYYSNALNDEDLASLTVDQQDVRQLLEANLHDPDRLPLNLLSNATVVILSYSFT